MKLISWNVNVRRDVAGQVVALAGYAPDIVALQEVARGRVPHFRAAFAAIGLPYLCETMTAWANPEANRYRERGVLIASRWPCTPLPLPPDTALALPWPERLLSATIAAPGGAVEVHTVYVPTGVRAIEPKRTTLTSLFARLAHPARADAPPRILCGDFNIPQAELSDGTLVTFMQRRTARGYSLPQTAARQQMHDAEALIMRGLSAHGLPDVFRQLHGYGVTDASWFVPTAGGTGAGFRLDHVFASRALRAQSCRYLHALREDRLSDHAAVEAVFDW